MNKEHQAFLTEKPIKLVFKYSLPAVISVIIHGVQTMIDGIFVGNFIGETALASVNIVGPFMQIIIGLSMIASIGTQSQVGIYLGSGEEKLAKDTFQSILRVASIVAIILSLTVFFASDSIARFLGADDLLIENSSIYIKTLAIFTLPMVLMFYFGFLDRILGKPQLYFIGSLLSLTTNLVLNYVFLVKLKMGVQGTAIATGLSFSVAIIVVIGPFLKKKNILFITNGKFNRKLIPHVLRNGASEGINAISAAVSIFLFNRALMSFAGADGVAAFTVINYIENFGALLLFGICDGIGPIVSYNFGAGELKRVRKTMAISYSGNFIFGVILFILLMFFNEPLISLFIKDRPDIVEFASIGAKIYSFAFLLSGANVLASGYFTFIGRGIESALIAMSRGLVFIVLGVLIWPKLFNVNGVWMTPPVAELITFLLTLILLKVRSLNKLKLK